MCDVKRGFAFGGQEMTEITIPMTKYQWIGLVTILLNGTAFGLMYFVNPLFGMILIGNLALFLYLTNSLFEDHEFKFRSPK